MLHKKTKLRRWSLFLCLSVISACLAVSVFAATDSSTAVKCTEADCDCSYENGFYSLDSPNFTGENVNYKETNGTYYNACNFVNGVCAGCGKLCEYVDEDEDGYCDICGEAAPVISVTIS